MSYFPSPDPQKLRNTFAHDHAFYTNIPAAPARSQPSPVHQQLHMNAAERAYKSNSQSMTWRSNEPHGLGLIPALSAAGSMEHGLPQSAEPLNMAFSWPSGFSTSQTASGMEGSRKDSWSEGCDPLSTLLHVGSTWSQPHTAQPEYHPSPARSEYSNSTQASCTSSPYTFSDSFHRPTSSPMVKLERNIDYVPRELQYIPESVPFDQSILVTPNDFVTQPPPTPNQEASISALHLDAIGVDEKPNFSSLQTLHHRTRPSEEQESSSTEGRTKRGFTKPETAICKCKQCGKLFQRSYNLKAHMETHDPHRSHPHLCEYVDCDKRFVRRTDLVRHEQSVHLKARNFPCPLCDSSFARKDTLRRHIDDGCPKRPEVKKRMARSRRSSAASGSRRPSCQYIPDASPALSPPRQPNQFA